MRELDVVGVRVEMPSNAPMVLLREVGGTRYLPIWIGANEASAIASAQEGVVPPRPLTHDLMVDTLRTLGHKLAEVHITQLDSGTFYALLLVDGIEVSARPSDAIALALRVGSDIYCAEDVLDEAGIEIPEAEDDEVEKFREFLDQVNPDDFVTGEEPKSESEATLKLNLRLTISAGGHLIAPSRKPQDFSWPGELSAAVVDPVGALVVAFVK